MIGPLAKLEVANNPKLNNPARVAAVNSLLVLTIQIYLRTSNSARQFLHLYVSMIEKTGSLHNLDNMIARSAFLARRIR